MSRPAWSRSASRSPSAPGSGRSRRSSPSLPARWRASWRELDATTCREAAEKRVTVRLRATDSSVLISVIDTGIGIPRENLERIFNHGFTTRPDGHGFGLHSSALAARELGGSLHAESAGPGKGATFTLALPLTSPESPDVR